MTTVIRKAALAYGDEEGAYCLIDVDIVVVETSDIFEGLPIGNYRDVGVDLAKVKRYMATQDLGTTLPYIRGEVLLDMPFMSTVAPTSGLLGDPPTLRASVATIEDYRGIVQPVKDSEARFKGARRVENLLLSSTDLTLDASNWVGFSATATIGHPDPLGGNTAARVTTTATSGAVWGYAPRPVVAGVASSAWIRLLSGGPITSITLNGNTLTIDTTWRKFGGLNDSGGFGNILFMLGFIAPIGTVLEVACPQSEDLYGLYYAGYPSEYIPTGASVASDAPVYNGAWVPGVKYFEYTSLNSIDQFGRVIEKKGPRIGSSPDHKWADSLGPYGHLQEIDCTNYCTYSRYLTNATYWLRLNASSTAVSGVDGSVTTGASAAKITAAAASGSIYRALTGLPNSTYFFGFDIKRFSDGGTGAIEVTTDGGTSWTDITSQVTEEWNQVWIDPVTVADTTATLGFKINGINDSIIVDYVQFQRGPQQGSRIQSTATAVTRLQDIFSWGTPAENINLNVGTWSAEITVTHGQDPDVAQESLIWNMGFGHDFLTLTALNPPVFSSTGAHGTSDVVTVPGEAQNVITSVAYTFGTKKYAYWKGQQGTEGTFVPYAGLGLMSIGFSAFQSLNGTIRNLKIRSIELTPEEIQEL